MRVRIPPPAQQRNRRATFVERYDKSKLMVSGVGSWLPAPRERRARRRDLAEFAPAATWNVVEQLILAATRRSPDEFAAAARRMSTGPASIDHNAQLLALFLLCTCVARLLGTNSDDESIASTASRIEPSLRQFVRVDRRDVEQTLRFGLRPYAPDVQETARTAILGSAVIGVIFEDPLAEIAELRDPAVREVERLLARRAGT